MPRPTMCFATMCKDEEECIRETLESVYKYIDYWVVYDTGSTDKTCQIVEDFFKEKNIPGELFIGPWEGFDKSKTKLFDRCFGKTEYILHLDADDLLCGNFEFTENDAGYLKYIMKTKRGGAEYKCSVIYNNSVRWLLAGVAHTIIHCLGNPKKLPDTKDLSDRDFYYESRGAGKRSEDKEKFLKDALKLRQQFFDTLIDDPYGINYRSVFYTAQSYFDQGMMKESAQFYSLYTKIKDTWIEEFFESNLRLITCFIELKYPMERILEQADKTIKIFEDRAEPYYTVGKYMNDIRKNDLAYKYLYQAKEKSLEDVNKKYVLFVRRHCYGKYVNDELSVACYWTNRNEEGKKYLMEIMDDPEFTHHKERFATNLRFFNERLEESKD